jgi:hypothetical protein
VTKEETEMRTRARGGQKGGREVQSIAVRSLEELGAPLLFARSQSISAVSGGFKQCRICGNNLLSCISIWTPLHVNSCRINLINLLYTFFTPFLGK